MLLNKIFNYLLLVFALTSFVSSENALAEDIGDFYSPPIARTTNKELEVVERYKVEVTAKKVVFDSDDPTEIKLEHSSATATYIYYLSSFLLNGDNSKVRELRASNKLGEKASDADLTKEQLIRQRENFKSLITGAVIEITHEYRVDDLDLVFLRQLIHKKGSESDKPFAFFIPKLMLIDGKYYIDDLERRDVERELVKVLREEFPFNERSFEKKKL
jgi:hypothetical protein